MSKNTLIFGCRLDCRFKFCSQGSKYGSVCLLTKDAVQKLTRYAQGGIAAVMYEPDTYNKHLPTL